MKIIIAQDAAAAARIAADILADTIRVTPDSVLGLATGRTMEAIYACLVADHHAGRTAFDRITSFNLDEYVGLSGHDPRSYRHYMQAHLFDHVGTPSSRVHVPDGTAPDLDAECAAYESAVTAAGGIGLQLLGIGDTGHIGFNEPPSPFDTRTRVVTLDAQTRAQNAPMFAGDPAGVPDRAITMGVGTILAARRLLLVATGPAKAAIVAAALEGPITPNVSASAVRLHHDTTVVLDNASAADLSPVAHPH